MPQRPRRHLNTRNTRWPGMLGKTSPVTRVLVQDRLGITGARWDLRGAEAVLQLRALKASGDWDNYWRFHCEQEHRRNYASAA